jgi:hypothetical protein
MQSLRQLAVDFLFFFQDFYNVLNFDEFYRIGAACMAEDGVVIMIQPNLFIGG